MGICCGSGRSDGANGPYGLAPARCSGQLKNSGPLHNCLEDCGGGGFVLGRTSSQPACKDDVLGYRYLREAVAQPKCLEGFGRCRILPQVARLTIPGGVKHAGPGVH